MKNFEILKLAAATDAHADILARGLAGTEDDNGNTLVDDEGFVVMDESALALRVRALRSEASRLRKLVR